MFTSLCYVILFVIWPHAASLFLRFLSLRHGRCSLYLPSNQVPPNVVVYCHPPPFHLFFLLLSDVDLAITVITIPTFRRRHHSHPIWWRWKLLSNSLSNSTINLSKDGRDELLLINLKHQFQFISTRIDSIWAFFQFWLKWHRHSW